MCLCDDLGHVQSQNVMYRVATVSVLNDVFPRERCETACSPLNVALLQTFIFCIRWIEHVRSCESTMTFLFVM